MQNSCAVPVKLSPQYFLTLQVVHLYSSNYTDTAWMKYFILSGRSDFCMICPSRLGLQNTPTVSLQKGKTLLMSVLVMILIVKLQ